MQQAARVVALENQCLRELLELRGVSRDEIDTYLSNRMGASRGTSSDVDRMHNKDSQRPRPTQSSYYKSRIATRDTSIPSPASLPHSRSSTAHAPSSNSTDSPSPSSPAWPTSPARRSTQIRYPTVGHSPASEEYTSEAPSLTSQFCNAPPSRDAAFDILGPVSDCFCPPDAADVARDHSPGHDSTLEMSCENAARILAELQGYGDSAELRSRLGCKESTDCRVKNTKLLQVMDELG
jgi:hypothetical protein